MSQPSLFRIAKSASVHVTTIFAPIALATLLSYVWPYTLDDSFITFRYSANLVAGYGPTFNANSAPIEGYTTFLWMLMMAVPHGLHLDVVVVSKIAGIVAVLLCGLVAYVFTRRLAHFLDPGDSNLVAGTAVFLFACYPATALHAVSGMETALFALLTTLFLFLTYVYADNLESHIASCLALVSLLLGLTRPEGNLVAFVGLLSLAIVIPSAARSRLIRQALLWYVVPGAIYFLWRSVYYGQLFPLPFYVKTAMQPLLAGRWQVMSFGLYMLTHVGVLTVLAISKLDLPLLPAILAAIALGVFYLFPAHVMGIEWRFLFPVVPFVFILAALGLGTIVHWMRSLNAPYTHTLGLVLGVTVAASMLAGAGTTIYRASKYTQGMQAAHIPLGKSLAGCTADLAAPVLAIGDAGAVPYYSGWYTIDTYGLNNNKVALSGRHDADDIIAEQPDLLVLISSSPDEFLPHLVWEEGIYQAAIEQGMVAMKTLRFDSTYYLWLMAYPQSPVLGCMIDLPG